MAFEPYVARIAIASFGQVKVSKVVCDLDVRRSKAAIVFLEILLAVPFILGLSNVFVRPIPFWTLVIPLGMMAGFLVHHLSLALRIDQGILTYRELFRGITRIPLGDIEKAHFAGWFTYRGRVSPPRRLVIVPKESSPVSQFNINSEMFDAGDIKRLLQALPTDCDDGEGGSRTEGQEGVR
jgi:hypothetical protein